MNLGDFCSDSAEHVTVGLAHADAVRSLAIRVEGCCNSVRRLAEKNVEVESIDFQVVAAAT